MATSRGHSTAELAIRCMLVVVAVAGCYVFDWHWLRHLTMVLNTRLDALAGVNWHPLASDTVVWRGAVYRYVIACTFADVWCGAIPLLWDQRRTTRHNLSLLLLFTPGLLVFNIARLTFSDVLFGHGVPWDLSHNVVSGISYFLIWRWLRRHGALARLWPVSQPSGAAAAEGA